MLVGFIKLDDPRLDDIDSFEVLHLDADGNTLDSTWYEEKSFSDVVRDFREQYKTGLQINILDYGHEIEGLVSAEVENGMEFYKILVLY